MLHLLSELKLLEFHGDLVHLVRAHLLEADLGLRLILFVVLLGLLSFLFSLQIVHAFVFQLGQDKLVLVVERLLGDVVVRTELDFELVEAVGCVKSARELLPKQNGGDAEHHLVGLVLASCLLKEVAHLVEKLMEQGLILDTEHRVISQVLTRRRLLVFLRRTQITTKRLLFGLHQFHLLLHKAETLFSQLILFGQLIVAHAVLERLVEVEVVAAQELHGVTVHVERAVVDIVFYNAARVDDHVEGATDVLLLHVRKHEGRDTNLGHHEALDGLRALPILVLERVKFVRLVLEHDLGARKL